MIQPVGSHVGRWWWNSLVHFKLSDPVKNCGCLMYYSQEIVTPFSIYDEKLLS